MLENINNSAIVIIPKDMEHRLDILKSSLQIEDNITKHLADLLDIKKDGSITLGNKSTALTLKTKPDNNIDIEERLMFSYKELTEDITKIISTAFNNVKKKINAKVRSEFFEKAFNDLKISIDRALESTNKGTVDIINLNDKQKTIFTKHLKDEIINQFYLLRVKD